MMKYTRHIISILTVILSSYAFGQQQQVSETLPSLIRGTVDGGNGKQVALLQRAGRSIQQISTAQIDEKGEFSLPANMSPIPGFYIVQLGGSQITLMMKGGDTANVTASADDFFQTATAESVHNSDLLNYHRTVMKFNMVQDSLRRALHAKTATQEQVNEFFKPIGETYAQERQAFIAKWQNSPMVLAPLYLNGVSRDQEAELFEQLLYIAAQNFQGTPVAGQLQREAERMKQQRLLKERTAPGKPAPEIALPNPEGDTMRLSDLKGKVVLIDFWASWCGPCRRENPNVVKTYNEYKDKGFTVFSVSLDKDASRWKQAIEQDNLSWPNHVSDLKAWGTSVIKDYGFSGIPYTVLIDEEGNIVKTNLRGPALEQELARILGSGE